MTQKEFLTNLCENNKEAVIVGSIGTISYDLTDIPHPAKVLIRGAMGAAVGCGLGMALALPEKKVIVVIGDGSLLMHLGSLTTVLKQNSPNLEIVVINNESYRSCGGQSTNFEYAKTWVSSLPMVKVYDIRT